MYEANPRLNPQVLLDLDALPVSIVPRMSNGELCLNKSNSNGFFAEIVWAGAGEQKCASKLFVWASCVLWRPQLESLCRTKARR